MESNNLVSSQNKITIFNKNGKNKKILLKSIIFFLVLLFILFLYIINLILNLNKKVSILNKNFELFNIQNKNKNKKDNQNDINDLNKPNEHVNNKNIIEDYIKLQNDFCNYPDKYINQSFEQLIKLTNFSFKNVSYQMYVYKKSDNYMSNEIIRSGKYEPSHMSNFLDALKYYGKSRNIIKNEDIYMLDIGGNLGAYPSFLGKLGYSVLTFEASPRNAYIIYKNFCRINRYSNIIIINKGLSNIEKTCNYFSQVDGIGNGIVLCNEDKERTMAAGYNFKKTFEIRLTKLSKFIPFLSDKNLALIKLDIEGAEGKVIEDAIELINKYHIPFIFAEFNPRYLKRQGTDPKKFIELFTKNGYKISYRGFLNSPYVNPEEINSFHNLYFIYSGK
jgi:FkbM family methyltransferase